MILQVAGLQEACNISGFVSSAKVIVDNCWPAGNGRLQSGITSQSVIDVRVPAICNYPHDASSSDTGATLVMPRTSRIAVTLVTNFNRDFRRQRSLEGSKRGEDRARILVHANCERRQPDLLICHCAAATGTVAVHSRHAWDVSRGCFAWARGTACNFPNTWIHCCLCDRQDNIPWVTCCSDCFRRRNNSGSRIHH